MKYGIHFRIHHALALFWPAAAAAAGPTTVDSLATAVTISMALPYHGVRNDIYSILLYLHTYF